MQTFSKEILFSSSSSEATGKDEVCGLGEVLKWPHRMAYNWSLSMQYHPKNKNEKGLEVLVKKNQCTEFKMFPNLGQMIGRKPPRALFD